MLHLTRAFGDKSKPPLLPEKTRETVLDMAGESQDGDRAEGEDQLAEEPDMCEGSQEPERQLSGEEGSSEGEGGEDLAASTDRMSLEEEKIEEDSSTVDQSPKGRLRMYRLLFKFRAAVIYLIFFLFGEGGMYYF